MQQPARSRWAVMATALVIALIATIAVSPATPAAAASVDRLHGADRYATAAAISQQAYPSGAPIVFLATGAGFADALSAAPAAAAQGGPLLLTATRTLPAATANEIRRLKPQRVVIVGGTGVVTGAVVTALRSLGVSVERVSGADRYETSRAIVERYFSGAETAWVATGANFPDALAASAAAGSVGGPVLLVNGLAGSLNSASRTTLNRIGASSVLIAGGVGVVSAGIEDGLRARGGDVQRLSGDDRYGTAVAINQYAFPAAERAFIATGIDFPDALAGAAFAGRIGAPLYSSVPTCLPPAVRDDIVSRLGASQVTLLGGSAVLGGTVGSLAACTSNADARAASQAELTNKITNRLASLPGTYSVSVRQTTGVQAVVNVRGATMQEPASVMKLFAVYAVLKRVDQGRLSMTTPTRSGVNVRDCIRVTIHISDNLCHWDLVALIGEQNLNNFFAAEGFSRTVYAGRGADGRQWSSKHTTTGDVALLLARLHNGSLLSAASTRFFIDQLETQLWRDRIPHGAPAGIPIANKTGQLHVSTGMIEADAGIVIGSRHTHTIAVIGSRNATAAGIAAIARVVYEHFNGAFGAAASYTKLNLVTTATVTAYSGPGSGTTRTVASGTRVHADYSSRLWYRVILGGTTVVYIHSSNLANWVSYPRRW